MPGYTRLHRADFENEAETKLYNPPLDRDRSLRNRPSYKFNHEERRANTINIMSPSGLFIPNFLILWQELLAN